MVCDGGVKAILNYIWREFEVIIALFCKAIWQSLLNCVYTTSWLIANFFFFLHEEAYTGVFITVLSALLEHLKTENITANQFAN